MPNNALAAWRRLSALPGGRCEVRIRNRRAIHNHLGTVNAIAMCCMAERAAGTMIDASLPPTHRWIPRGMTVDYLKKAATDLRAVAQFESELRPGTEAA
jgi:acyl-coenzyme A thioesterase PaaI-like protein